MDTLTRPGCLGLFLQQNLGVLALKQSEEDLREIPSAVPIDDVPCRL